MRQACGTWRGIGEQQRSDIAGVLICPEVQSGAGMKCLRLYQAVRAWSESEHDEFGTDGEAQVVACFLCVQPLRVNMGLREGLTCGVVVTDEEDH